MGTWGETTAFAMPYTFARGYLQYYKPGGLENISLSALKFIFLELTALNLLPSIATTSPP